MRVRLFVGLISVAALLTGIVDQSFGQVESRSFKVAVRTLRFVAEPPKGQTEVAIVFAPSDPQSKREAEEIQALLGEGLSIRGATLVPVLVPVDRLEALEGRRFAFIAGDLGEYQDAIFAATRKHGVLSIATRAECVEEGRCVMAVTTHPRVEVLVSRSASVASSIEFATAFRMLIREL